MSPPIPVDVGSVTLSAATAATAASAAFPPLARISSPAAVAKGWDVATIPLRPYTEERREVKGKEVIEVSCFRCLSDNLIASIIGRNSLSSAIFNGNHQNLRH